MKFISFELDKKKWTEIKRAREKAFDWFVCKMAAISQASMRFGMSTPWQKTTQAKHMGSKYSNYAIRQNGLLAYAMEFQSDAKRLIIYTVLVL